MSLLLGTVVPVKIGIQQNALDSGLAPE